jgi:hypothetical protein
MNDTITNSNQTTTQQKPVDKTSSKNKGTRNIVVFVIIAITFFVIGAAVASQSVEQNTSKSTAVQQELVGSSDYSDIEACDILRQKDVESVLGGTVFKEQASIVDTDNKPPVSTLCAYTADRNPANGITRLTLDHYKGDLTVAKATFESYKSITKDSSKATAVSGVGDGAFWTPSGTTSLTVLKGDTIFVITLGDPVIEKRTQERTKELALKALNRY